jgi:hypothetical protein
MCLIHIDESVIYVFAVARPSRLCVAFSEKLDNLPACLDNQSMMLGFQCDACEWARGDQNEAHYCSITTLPSYKYFLRLALITILHSITSLLRVFLSPSSLNHDGRQERN